MGWSMQKSSIASNSTKKSRQVTFSPLKVRCMSKSLKNDLDIPKLVLDDKKSLKKYKTVVLGAVPVEGPRGSCI